MTAEHTALGWAFGGLARRLFAGLTAALALAVLGAQPSLGLEGASVRTDNVTARLVADAEGVAPGGVIHVGLHKQIRPRWHTYWRNPGDAGEPTKITWGLPAGFAAGEIAWPAPKSISIGGLVTNYGYEGELLLVSPITAPVDAQPGEVVTFTADAYWLVCEDICIPEEAQLTLEVPVVAAPTGPAPRWGREIMATLAAIPTTAGFSAGLESTAEGVRLTVAHPSIASAIAGSGVRNVEFFPFSGAAIDHAAPQPLSLGTAGFALDLKPGPDLRQGLRATPGVIAFEAQDGGSWRRRVVEIAPGLSAVDVGLLGATGGRAGPAAPETGMLGFLSGEGGLLGYLIGAVIGGLILNLMPCVFPVLFIKALGFAKRAHDAPGEVRRHGLVFLGGVLSTFLVLAGALIALKAAGQQVGWGFQLQDPVFVAALALLMFTIGLNLMGAFEIGGGLQNLGSGLAARGGDVGAFFTGVLAVVVATPCTAPFMAGAVGFALAQPAWASLAVFAALGLGLALPFVALSFAPGLLRLLPKPGAWMDTLKQLFAFPMFLTAVWLVWTLAQQSGAAGVGLVLLAMTALGFGVWVLRATSGRSGVGAWVGRGAAAVFVIAALAGVAGQRAATPAASASATAALEEAAWSPQKVESLRASGKSVFVDFTAAWCITCQFNKRAALTTPEVRSAFAAADVVFLTADWTNRDDVIAAELERHGRSGVPLYLLYAPTGAPVILPQLLTPDIVIAAVDGLDG